MTEVGITVIHEPGGRLPNGDFSGLGGRTRYQVVVHDHERDATHTSPVGPLHDTPREADAYATAVSARYSSAMRQTDAT